MGFALAVVDRFSGYAVVVRMTDKQTQSVIATLMIHVVYLFGEMQDLSVDGAKEFNSADMEDWAERHNIHMPRPLPHNPTGNTCTLVANCWTAASRSSGTYSRNAPRIFGVRSDVWHTRRHAGDQLRPRATQQLITRRLRS